MTAELISIMDSPNVTDHSTYGASMGFSEGVSGIEQFPFTDIETLQKTLETYQRMLQENKQQDQFLLFTNVPPDKFSEVSCDSFRPSKSCRFCYCWSSYQLLVKIVPGAVHGITSRSFHGFMKGAIDSMGLKKKLHSLGSTTFRIGSLAKEADECWSPALRPPAPTLVLDVGFSEPARELAIEARGWLEARESPVKLAVTVCINRNWPEIVVRCWKLCHREDGPPRGACFQEIKIVHSANTITATGNLVFPFEQVMGRPADPSNPLETDFIISRAELEDMGEEIFTEQGYI
jgi:hypothetical protein